MPACAEARLNDTVGQAASARRERLRRAGILDLFCTTGVLLVL